MEWVEENGERKPFKDLTNEQLVRALEKRRAQLNRQEYIVPHECDSIKCEECELDVAVASHWNMECLIINSEIRYRATKTVSS